MITRHPDVPDNIFELKPLEKIGDYARKYGDEIARQYEAFNIIYIPHFPLDFDLDFFQRMTFPEEGKKVGDNNGLSNNLIVRRGKEISFDYEHILCKMVGEPLIAAYVQSQIAMANLQLDAALRQLFPKYFSLSKFNVSWRMTETNNEGLHVDGFRNGKPISETLKRNHRIKAFVNIDTAPRHWSTSFTVPELLKRYRSYFPDTMPDDLDAVATYISRCGMLNNVPTHEIRYPTMSAVIGEAQVITHAIRYGRRMIAAEYTCLEGDMLDPAANPHRQLSRWLKDSGIEIGPMPKPQADLVKRVG